MTQPAGQTDRIGEVLDGKYRITRIIGQGGMGAVYAGEHIRVKRTVAIKILHAGANGVDEMAERFEREAQAAGQIGSEHIVEVYDLGMTAAGERFMVMEYLEGEPLRTRIKRQGRLSPAEIVTFFGELLEGLAGAHLAGIIHRDLKPDNVFLVKEKAGRRDFVKILDFGISKFTHMEDGAMTRTGVVMGSPNYMSPEHVKTSSEVDARSDLYSVGIMVFEAACGQVPRRGATFAELLFKVVYEPVPDVRTIAPDVPATLAQIIHKACAAERTQRFQTAAEFRAALVALGRELDSQLAEAGTGRFVDETSGQSTVALSAAGLGPGFSSGVIAPTASQPSFGAGSQPSFGAGSQPSFGAGAQPSYGAGSQPSFGAGSQPSFGAGSQPSYGAGAQPAFGAGAQPSYGAGAQPSYGAGSQPSFVGVAQPTPAHAGSAAQSRGGRSMGVLAIAAAAIVGVGLSLAVAYVAVGGKQPAAAAGSAPKAGSTAATARAPAEASVAAPAEIPSAAASAEVDLDADAPVASATAGSTPTAKAPRPTQRTPVTKPTTTAKPAATSAPATKPTEPDLGY